MHTKDLGIYIRDMIDIDLEDGSYGYVDRFNWDDNPDNPDDTLEGPAVHVDNVDASDADNLIITNDAGEKFRVTITRIG